MKRFIVILLMAVISMSCVKRHLPPPETTTNYYTFDIVTYNIKIGLMGFSQVVDNLIKINPDFVFLQEVHGPATQAGYVNQAAVLAANLSFYHVFAKAQQWVSGEYGIAILSKYPIIDEQVWLLPNDPGEEQEVLLKVVVSTPRGYVSLYNTHFIARSHANNDASDLRLRQARAVLDIVLADRRPLIIGGDLNSYGLSPVKRLFRNNFTDIFEEVGNGKEATFPNYFPVLRLDYLFTRAPFVPVQSSIIYLEGSDHFPLWARLGVF